MRKKKASEGENIIENRDMGHLAGSVVLLTLDLRVVSSSHTVGVEIT